MAAVRVRVHLTQQGITMANNSLSPSAALVASVKSPAAPQVYDTAAIQKLDTAHYMHPFTDHKALGEKGARVMVRGEGIYLWDSQGKKVLDGMYRCRPAMYCLKIGAADPSSALKMFMPVLASTTLWCTCCLLYTSPSPRD